MQRIVHEVVVRNCHVIAASRGAGASVEHGGADVLAALRFAGFNVTFDEGMNLACDGECHEERVSLHVKRTRHFVSDPPSITATGAKRQRTR